MSKIELDTDIRLMTSKATPYNDNFRKIEEEFQDKVLYRDNPSGEPNSMESPLDMNNNRIYNLPEPLTDNEPVRKGDLQAFGAAVQEIIPGAGIAVDSSNPNKPIVSSLSGTAVATIGAGTGISVDASSPTAPIVSADLSNPTGSGINLRQGAQWKSLIAGSNISFNQAIAGEVEISAASSGGDMLSSNNLSDVSSASASRSNLGLGTAATKDVGAGPNDIPTNSTLPPSTAAATSLAPISGLSGATVQEGMEEMQATAIVESGKVTALQAAAGNYVVKANNLSDIPNAATARTNLGLGTASTYSVGTGPNDIPINSSLSGGGDMMSSNNLSDVASIATSRTNLGLGSAATYSVGSGASQLPTNTDITSTLSGYLSKSGNLTGLGNVATARSNLGLGTAATANIGVGSSDIPSVATVDSKVATKLGISNNLSDLNNTTTARTNLGLGAAATYPVGTATTSLPTGANVQTRIDTTIANNMEGGHFSKAFSVANASTLSLNLSGASSRWNKGLTAGASGIIVPSIGMWLVAIYAPASSACTRLFIDCANTPLSGGVLRFRTSNEGTGTTDNCVGSFVFNIASSATAQRTIDFSAFQMNAGATALTVTPQISVVRIGPSI